MKSRREKSKGYNQTLKYSNGLELQFLTCTVTWVFSRYVRILCRISRKGTDRQVVNVLDGINDVFNDSTLQEGNWHRHMAQVDLAVITTARI